MEKTLKRHGSAEQIIADGLLSGRATMSELGNAEKQELAAGPITGWRTAARRPDDESARCSGSGK